MLNCHQSIVITVSNAANVVTRFDYKLHGCHLNRHQKTWKSVSGTILLSCKVFLQDGIMYAYAARSTRCRPNERIHGA